MADHEDPFIAAMIAKGHTPRMNDDGSVDIFVTDVGHHNGPGCSVCRDTWCQHCTAPEKIEPCIEAEAQAALDAKHKLEREERILAEADEIRARRNSPLPSSGAFR